MRKPLLTILLLTVFLGFAKNSWCQQFKVIKVYDGDTIRVTRNHTEIVVRLVGCDAPEISNGTQHMGQPYAKEAAAYLGSLILDRDVRIKGYGYIQNHILRGEIFRDGVNINLRMVEAGLAEVPKEQTLPAGFDPKPYLEAEGRAKSGPEGMWVLGDAYVSPAKWRNRHHTQSAAALLLYGILEEGTK